METVLAAFIIIFIILFAVLSLSYAVFIAQDSLHNAWQDMEARYAEQAQSDFELIDMEIVNAGSDILLTVENRGGRKLADFDEWDVIVQYYDDGTPANYHIEWLSYLPGGSASNRWTTDGFFLDTAEAIPEVYEPNVLNPGEELVIRVMVEPLIGEGTTVQTVIAGAAGMTDSTFATRNFMPDLINNNSLVIATGDTASISSSLLMSTDADGSPADLTYTIVASPLHGSLSLGGFTQADIDAGLLTYSHIGTEPDGFQFTITDGIDTLGPFTFNILISQPPVLINNEVLSLASGGSADIDTALLQVTDPDDLPTTLIYTIVTPPAAGTLSLSGSFAQADIDSGLLNYSHSGGGDDSFAFTVYDGETMIGPYIFTIDAS